MLPRGTLRFSFRWDSLDKESIEEILGPKDVANFEEWKANGEKPAWFFLDAVDELKLTQGKLDRALNRLSRDLGGSLDRARIIVSCRHSDWRPEADRHTFEVRLPIPEERSGDSSLSCEDAFIRPLRPEPEADVFEPLEVKSDVGEKGMRIVTMLPLNKGQIKIFAERSGLTDVEAFLEEIDRQNARDLALRPLDLGQLIETWRDSGSLGTLAERHEVIVRAKLKDGPDRPDSGVLSESKAERGAERLALALALTRRRTIRSVEQNAGPRPVENTLDAEEILSDWTPEERQALLRRAVFDPATYGRIRFHHRSVQDFLAARRLSYLREKGMPTKELLRLLFAEQYGVKVVLPSMRAIAAWLALREPAVRRELIEREPETLIHSGDPGTLSISARGDLVRAFVSHYGEGNSRGLNFMADDVLRLAHPELAPVIRGCWGTWPDNPDVRGLLLQLIWLGPVPDCMDLALAAARDPDRDAAHRIVAIRALLAGGCNDTVRQLADEMLACPASWPTEIVSRVFADLFPHIITVEELVEFIRVRAAESERRDQDLSFELRQVVETVDPESEEAVGLRNSMADLIWLGRESGADLHELHSEYGLAAPALAMLCERQLTKNSGNPSEELLRASVIASRFGWDESGSREPVGRLRQCFDAGSGLRSGALWVEVAFTDEIIPCDDARLRLNRATTDSLVGRLGAADRGWLEEALAEESCQERRAVALCALIQDWNMHGKDPSRLETIHEALNGDGSLLMALTKWMIPPEKKERLEKVEQAAKERACTRAAVEARRLEEAKAWRNEVVADPAGAFSGTKRNATLLNLYRWLSEVKSDRLRYSLWNKEAVVEAFSQEVADLAETALRDLWRTIRPVPWSERAAQEKGHTSGEWLLGFQGLVAEATRPGWTAGLSETEVKMGVVYATGELNEFAPFIADLVESHPEEVQDLIGGEISAELRLCRGHNSLPSLQHLSRADVKLKRLLIPHLIAELDRWPRDCGPDHESNWEHHLELVLDIVDSSEDEAQRAKIAQECLTRYESDPSGPLALAWLRGLFRFDAARGAETMAREFSSADDSETRERATEAFAALVRRDQAIHFQASDSDQRAVVLGQLVRLAHVFVRPQDDVVHEGAYSPETRDNAETARDRLFSLLLDTPGAVARGIVLELAKDEEFARSGDRLRHLARQRAATDADFEAYDSKDVIELEMRHELPPQDRNGLFDCMMNRLEDIHHDVLHHDFSIKQTIRVIHGESEVQRYIALELHNRSKGVYEVTREDEVADRNRTDIRLYASNCRAKAVIEVKIADNWTVNELEMALRDQLLGRYMRHATCKAGCMLLTFHGRKKYWKNPGTGKRIDFPDLVRILGDKAQALEGQNKDEVRLAVFGIDLANPG